MRRPGIRKDRGTQVGARRSRPSPASSAWRTKLSGFGAPAAAAGARFFLVTTVFFAMLRGLPGNRQHGAAQETRSPAFVCGDKPPGEIGYVACLYRAAAGQARRNLPDEPVFWANQELVKLQQTFSVHRVSLKKEPTRFELEGRVCRLD